MTNAIFLIQVNDAILLFNRCPFLCILYCLSELLLLWYGPTEFPARASRSPGHVLQSWEARQGLAGPSRLALTMWLSNAGFVLLLLRVRMEVRNVDREKTSVC